MKKNHPIQFDLMQAIQVTFVERIVYCRVKRKDYPAPCLSYTSNLLFFQVTKNPVKSDKRPVLGSKLSSNRPSLVIASSDKKSQKSQSTSFKAHAGNALDSTAPAIKRGKEREKPKKKRPSKMRKIIAAERAAKLVSQPNMQVPKYVSEDLDNEAKSNDNKSVVDERTGGVSVETSIANKTVVRV